MTILTSNELASQRSSGSAEEQLAREMRLLGADIIRMEQAVADLQGLNTTDLHCLEIIHRMGPLAASELAAASGVSRAAVTTIIDRLERDGWVRRAGDPSDRRRVIVKLTESAGERSRHAFAGLVRDSLELHGTYSAEQLELLLDFVRRTRELLDAHRLRVRGQQGAAED